MKRWFGGLVLSGLLAATLAIPAMAADGDVAMGGVMILRVIYPQGTMTVKQRADAITDRINDVLSDGSDITASDIQVKTINKEVALTVKDQLIITVDKKTADYNKATPQQLGEMWAKHLREVLPELSIHSKGNKGI